MNDALLPLGQGVSLIVVYSAAMLLLAWAVSRHGLATKSQFLLADRRLGVWESAFSIAATWIWAPALFLSSQKAYQQGLPGVFWFTVPNVACLIVFGWFAQRIRRLVPDGFTLSDYMRHRYSGRVQALYLIQMAGLAACSFAVQLLAGGKVLAFLTGVPFVPTTLALALLALAYSLMSGLRASVATDYAQMIIILVVSAVAVPWAVHAAGGWGVVCAGLAGRSGEFGSLFHSRGASVAWSFGVPVTIGLMAGPFGDQSFWQRAFATEEGQVRAAFTRGALIFAVVPILLSLLGFAAAGQGFDAHDPALVNVEIVRTLLPRWVLLPVTFMLLSGLVSTLDSNLCAIASMAGHDLLGHADGRRVVRVSRWSMVALAAVGLAIANVPGLKILYLFLFYGTLRASTLLPTVITLLTNRPREQGMFLGILASIVVGLPVFAYGNFKQVLCYKVIGAILTVAVSGAIVVATWCRRDGGPAVTEDLDEGRGGPDH